MNGLSKLKDRKGKWQENSHEGQPYYNFYSFRKKRHTKASVKRIKKRFTPSKARSTEIGREIEIKWWEKDEYRVKGHSSDRRRRLHLVQQKCGLSELKTHVLSLWRKCISPTASLFESSY